jgi:hypothetical protein
LIANTGEIKGAIPAVKAGNTAQAVKQIGGPLRAAIKELWAAGGMRSLFAGESYFDARQFSD